jgi:hypothetical protein
MPAATGVGDEQSDIGLQGFTAAVAGQLLE